MNVTEIPVSMEAPVLTQWDHSLAFVPHNGKVHTVKEVSLAMIC